LRLYGLGNRIEARGDFPQYAFGMPELANDSMAVRLALKKYATVLADRTNPRALRSPG
jgi:hypothetical protein